MRGLIIFLLLSVPWPSFAASMIECGYRENTIAIEQCRKQVVNDAKKEMERYYQKAKEVRSENPKVIKALDASQTHWLAYKRSHCSSVYEAWSGGTIRGMMYLECVFKLTKERTHNIWSDHLTYMDSTPSILPEPFTGFDVEQSGDHSNKPLETWSYGDWSVAKNSPKFGVVTSEVISKNSILQILYSANECDNPLFMLFTPIQKISAQSYPAIVPLTADIDGNSLVIMATPRTDALEDSLLVFHLKPFTSLPSQLRKGNSLSFFLKNPKDSEVARSVLDNHVTFSLKGFVASELKAKEQCAQL